MCKYGVIHKTGNAHRPPEENRATAIGNLGNRHKKFGEDRTCISGDMIGQSKVIADCGVHGWTLQPALQWSTVCVRRRCVVPRGRI